MVKWNGKVVVVILPTKWCQIKKEVGADPSCCLVCGGVIWVLWFHTIVICNTGTVTCNVQMLAVCWEKNPLLKKH